MAVCEEESRRKGGRGDINSIARDTGKRSKCRQQGDCTFKRSVCVLSFRPASDLDNCHLRCIRAGVVTTASPQALALTFSHDYSLARLLDKRHYQGLFIGTRQSWLLLVLIPTSITVSDNESRSIQGLTSFIQAGSSCCGHECEKQPGARREPIRLDSNTGKHCS